MASKQRSVRPTFGCLEVLGVKKPSIDVALDSVDHPLVAKAQKIPDLLEAHEAEPILSLRDRRWLKVKTGEFRGGMTAVDPLPQWSHVCEDESFWLGLAGRRQADTPSRDFYAKLPTDTKDFLPKDLDWKRWYAEQAWAAKSGMQEMVRKCAWLSLSTSRAFCFQVGDALIWVRVRMMESNIVYIAIGAHGLADPQTYAVLMSSFPDVAAEEWLPEPDGVAELEVESGEMIFSAILSPVGQNDLLKEADQREWALEL